MESVLSYQTYFMSISWVLNLGIGTIPNVGIIIGASQIILIVVIKSWYLCWMAAKLAALLIKSKLLQYESDDNLMLWTRL